MDTYAAIVLAAGKGTRMRSTLPKVLHQVAGLPLLAHVLNAIDAIPSTAAFAPLTSTTTSHRPIVVLGHEAQQVEDQFGTRCHYAFQEEQLGTGHAVLAAENAVQELNPTPQTILVCYGDTPLISGQLLARVLFEHLTNHATMTFLTAISEQPSDFGRIVRDTDGHVRAIVEMKRATEEQKRINEVNSGIYCFDQSWLWPALHTLPRNASGEYYLTDLVAVASSQGCKIATVSGSFDETIGINDRVQLAAAERLLRTRVLEQLMYAGVTILDPPSTYIDAHVEIGSDTVILPGTMITGKTRIGPFSHCRPGAHLARNVRMGNFGEVKNSYIGAETDIHHFSYVGDATLGEHVNIGAGTITCNYDGVKKNRTTIGDGASIGSDTMLIAPVTVGEYAKTGAGSVVNRDVPPGAVVVGVPARVLRMPQPSDGSTTEDVVKE